MEYIGISLQEYLIKYSHIDKQFIEDFIAIQESDITQEFYPFVVYLDLVIKWLDIKDPKSFRKNIFKSYKHMIDFIILDKTKTKKMSINVQTDNRGGHNKLFIMLTVPCFKRIVLSTKSDMRDKVMDYYLSLENLVIEYQKYITSILIRENKLLKDDLKKEIFPGG